MEKRRLKDLKLSTNFNLLSVFKEVLNYFLTA